ncbi:hypothetical protein [Kineosporia babensis]|uniref:Uncharacterized protein n=1 Tax=Kineosporia babensis TaxID=499548 RepID=A0A9X1SS65_9ACTN|nr:hypothetical protein [Kineosporia babensis]MCD5310332.1 hypothetical protein [Kineosporia babensis]
MIKLKVRIPFASTVAATVVLSSLLFLPASRAQTEAVAATCKITPGTVTLGQRSRNVGFDVPSAQQWTLEAGAIGLYLYDTATGEDAVAQFIPQRFANRDAGRIAVKVKRQNGETVTSCSSSFRLRRAADLSIAVARQGKDRKISGKLRRVNFGSQEATWANHGGQPVKVMYRAQSGRWITAKTVKTAKNGTFSTKLRSGERDWRVVYPGSVSTGAKTSRTVTR